MHKQCDHRSACPSALGFPLVLISKLSHFIFLYTGKKSEMPQASPVSGDESVSTDTAQNSNLTYRPITLIGPLPWIKTVASVLWVLHPNFKIWLCIPSITQTSPFQPLSSPSLSPLASSSVQTPHSSLSSFSFFSKSFSPAFYAHISLNFDVSSF